MLQHKLSKIEFFDCLWEYRAKYIQRYRLPVIQTNKTDFDLFDKDYLSGKSRGLVLFCYLDNVDLWNISLCYQLTVGCSSVASVDN